MGDSSSRLGISGIALIVGAISFAVGFVGPLIIYPEANLGPLLGIFVTGPVGFVAGMLIGIARSALRPEEGLLRRELKWLAIAWMLSLFFMLIYAFGGLGWVAIAVQVAVVATGVFLLEKRTPQLPKWARQSGPIVLLASALTIVTSLFPPLDSEAGPIRFAFFLDQRFDASHNVPEFSVNETLLIGEWLIIAAVTAVIFLLLRARATSRGQ